MAYIKKYSPLDVGSLVYSRVTMETESGWYEVYTLFTIKEVLENEKYLVTDEEGNEVKFGYKEVFLCKKKKSYAIRRLLVRPVLKWEYFSGASFALDLFMETSILLIILGLTTSIVGVVIDINT